MVPDDGTESSTEGSQRTVGAYQRGHYFGHIFPRPSAHARGCGGEIRIGHGRRGGHRVNGMAASARTRALGKIPRGSFMPKIGDPDRTRTDDLCLDSAMSPILFYIARYVFRTSRPAHPRDFVPEVLSSIAQC